MPWFLELKSPEGEVQLFKRPKEAALCMSCWFLLKLLTPLLLGWTDFQRALVVGRKIAQQP